MAWLTDWKRRKSRIINGTIAGAQTDYQMKITLHKGPGTDTTTDIYLGTNVNNDFSDVRFTDSDGTTLLSYWVESLTINVSAVIWIKIPNIPISPNSTTIYIYYDNIIATSQSNGNNTFVFFDDFESGTIDPNKWATKISYGSVGIRTDYKYGNYSIGSDQGPGQGCCWPAYVIPDQNHYFMKLPDGNDIQYLVSMKTKRWTTAWQSGCGVGFGGDTVIYNFPWDNIWGNYDIILQRTSSSNINYHVAVNGVWETPGNIAIAQGTILQFGVQTEHFGPGDNDVYVRSDDFRVRKYASPEPTFGTSGLANSAWPKFRHDIENTGQSQFPSYADGTLKWATNPLKMIKPIYAIPAISSTDIIYVADPDGVLRSFNSDLVQQWIFDTGAEVTSQPAIDPIDGTIYVGNAAGRLYALNPSDGSVKWYSIVSGAIRESPIIGPNPLNPSINALYVASDAGPGNGYVYAINPADGSSVMIDLYITWYYIANTPIRTTPTIGADGTIYVGGYDGRLHAINPAPYGTFPYVREKWIYDTGTGSPINLSPAVSPLDGSIYFGITYTGIYCVNSTGGLKWPYAGMIETHPVVDTNGNVYFGLASGFVSFDPTGILRWSQSLVNATYYSKPLIQGSYIYVGKLSGICAYALEGTPKYSCDINISIYYPFGSPVIASTGMMYAVTYNTYDENALQAFTPTNDPSPGSVSLYARAIASAPVIATDGTIYFGSENNRLYATNPDGSSKWVSTIINYAPILTPPAISLAGIIYFSCDDGVFAVSSDGMSKLWDFYVWGYDATSPTIDPLTGFIYIADNSGNLFAIDPATYDPRTGTAAWQYSTPSGAAISSCPAISPVDGTIYFGDINGDVYAIDPTTYNIKWYYSIGIPITTSPAVSPVNGNIYITAADTLFAIEDNITYGSLRWSYLPFDGSFMRGSPAVGSDGTIYVTTDEPTIYALNPDKSPKLEIPIYTKYSMSSISITTNGTLIIGFDNGDITAYNTVDGTELWNYTTTRPVTSSPAIASDGTIYATNKDGILYSFSSTGTLDISSTPSGASISIDGIPQGVTTNTIITGIAAKTHTALLTLLGYLHKTITFDIAVEGTTYINTTLTPIPYDPILNGRFNLGLIEWTPITVDDADIIWDTNGSAKLRVRCGDASLEQSFTIDQNLLSFDWRTSADGLPENVNWKLTVNLSGVPTIVIDEAIPVPGYEVSGSRVFDVSAYYGETATITFYLTRGPNCSNADHGYTYLWVDNVKQSPTIDNTNISTTPPGATIFIDGEEEIGAVTPFTMQGLLPGIHTYKFTYPIYYDATGTFSVTTGTTTILSIVMTPLPGEIVVDSVPQGAEIFLDGVDKGVVTPFTLANITTLANVTPGDHIIILKLPGYIDRMLTTTVTSQQTTTITTILSPTYNLLTDVRCASSKYHRDLRNSGQSIYPSYTDGTIKWIYSTNKSVRGSPAIDIDGTIYIGDSDGNFYAINPDGTLKWTYPAGGSQYSSPVISHIDEAIYTIGMDINTGMSGLHAFNPDGTLKWFLKLDSESNTAPTIDTAGNIYVGIRKVIVGTPSGGYLYKINPSGGIEWEYSTGGSYDNIDNNCPAISPSDGTVYAKVFEYDDVTYTNTIYLYAFDPSNGVPIWSTYIGDAWTRSQSPSIAEDGTIYIAFADGSNCYLYAINPVNGSINWQYRIGTNQTESCPAIATDGTIYIGNGDYNNPRMYAITNNGDHATLKWYYPVRDKPRSPPTIDLGGNIYFGTDGVYDPVLGYDIARFYALNPDGTLRWYKDIMTNNIVSSPSIAPDGTIYVGVDHWDPSIATGFVAFQSTYITPPVLTPCPTSLRYENDIIHLSTTPKDGIGPYYVEFIKNIEGIDTVLDSYTDAPENIEITYDYTLTNEDIRTALSGTIDFTVSISDSCPTGAKTCTETCTIYIGCVAPVCNFTIT